MSPRADDDRAEAPATLEQVRTAQDEALRVLAGIPEVVGFGIDRAPGGFILKVNLTAPSAAVPATIGGLRVEVEVRAGAAKKKNR
jgi:hypothetical protein